MSRIRSTLIALGISAAATAGLYAAVATAQLGQARSAPSTPVQQLASRQAKLAAWGRSLDAALAKRPPALPKLPHFVPVSAQLAPAAPVAPVATVKPHVTYVQPPPVVKYKPASPPATTTTTSSSGEDEHDEDDGEDDPAGSDD